MDGEGAVVGPPPFIQEDGMGRERGVTFLELIVALAIIGLGLAVALPNLVEARRAAGLKRVARVVIAHTHLCRLRAINARRKAGLIFARQPSGWVFTPTLDGDGDGVSRRDLERGIDTPLEPTVRLETLCAGAAIGVPQDWRVPNPSGRGRLRVPDGLAAGRSDIISFSPLGDATPSTVYVNDGGGRLLAIRIYGATARVRVLEWRTGWPRWRQLAL